MKVGIIGGGIAGLTCGYRLAQKGINSIIFEKEPLVGGRLPYAVAIASPRFYLRLSALIKELGLTEVKRIPLIITKVAFIMPNGKWVGMEALPLVLLKLGLKSVLYFLKLALFALRLNFSVKKFDPRLVKLREISFEEYLKGCPEGLKDFLLRALRGFHCFPELNFSQVSASSMMVDLRFLTEIFFGTTRILKDENNLGVIAKALDQKIKEMGFPVLTSAEVKKVERKGEKFLLSYQREGEKKEEVDKVVLATPLTVTKEIFPELKLETNIWYPQIRSFSIEGKLKKPKRRLVVGLAGNPVNLGLVINTFPRLQHVYPLDKAKPIDFQSIYSEYKVIDEKILTSVLPIFPPGVKVPELKTEIKGVYLCGDFYYYPSLEMAIETGEMVAELIKKEE